MRMLFVSCSGFVVVVFWGFCLFVCLFCVCVCECVRACVRACVRVWFFFFGGGVTKTLVIQYDISYSVIH